MRLLRFLVSCCVACAASAPAIVIRHDVEDSAYFADEAGYPFLFALYRMRRGYRDCIATLIHPSWAITAAHCTRDASFVTALSASSPSFEVEIGGRHAFVNRVVRHPDEGGRPVDLALIHFSTALASIRPVALYRFGDEAGRTVLLPGWGSPGNGLQGVRPGDGRFRVAENRIDAAIGGLLVWAFDDPRSLIGRAVPREGISGPGDSGGPALVMTPQGWAIIGVSSGQRTFGRAEGLYGAEEEYVRVSSFAAWIDGIVAGE
jgi:hypothetical protein